MRFNKKQRINIFKFKYMDLYSLLIFFYFQNKIEQSFHINVLENV